MTVHEFGKENKKVVVLIHPSIGKSNREKYKQVMICVRKSNTKN